MASLPIHDVPGSRIQRFYSLDVLRGIAALSVVFWHWQHFFMPDVMNRALVPFSIPARRLYTHGWMAVELFFQISGFIFFWLYADKIATQKIDFRRFFQLRISRLWPLHVVTLILVGALQFVYFRYNGSYFVYQNNGPVEFLQQLLFLNAWNTTGENSFNGPAWSISAEMFLYALFFLVARTAPKIWIIALIAAAGQFFFENGFPVVVRGIESFFLGGVVYYLHRRIQDRRTIAVVVATTCVIWIAGLGVSFSHLGPQSPSLAGLPWMETVFRDWPRLVLFPTLVLSLSLIEKSRGHLGRRISFVGDISYSSYLLHFPLQIVAVIITGWLSIDRAIFYEWTTMVAFFAVLIPLSVATHRYFEMPAQSWMRQRLGASTRAVAG